MPISNVPEAEVPSKGTTIPLFEVPSKMTSRLSSFKNTHSEKFSVKFSVSPSPNVSGVVLAVILESVGFLPSTQSALLTAKLVVMESRLVGLPAASLKLAPEVKDKSSISRSVE